MTANAITVIHSNKRDTVCQQQKLQILTVFVDDPVTDKDDIYWDKIGEQM